MKALFSASPKPGSVLIRAGTWSRFSHVALVDGDEVIEAVWPKVRVAPLAEVMALHSVNVLARLPCRDPDIAIRAARSQLGKPYDLTAVVGIGLHRNWQETDSWFCSELLAWALAQSGSPLFRAEALHRVVPQHLWMLSTDY